MEDKNCNVSQSLNSDSNKIIKGSAELIQHQGESAQKLYKQTTDLINEIRQIKTNVQDTSIIKLASIFNNKQISEAKDLQLQAWQKKYIDIKNNNDLDTIIRNSNLDEKDSRNLIGPIEIENKFKDFVQNVADNEFFQKYQNQPLFKPLLRVIIVCQNLYQKQVDLQSQINQILETNSNLKLANIKSLNVLMQLQANIIEYNSLVQKNNCIIDHNNKNEIINMTSDKIINWIAQNNILQNQQNQQINEQTIIETNMIKSRLNQLTQENESMKKYLDFGFQANEKKIFAKLSNDCCEFKNQISEQIDRIKVNKDLERNNDLRINNLAEQILKLKEKIQILNTELEQEKANNKENIFNMNSTINTIKAIMALDQQSSNIKIDTKVLDAKIKISENKTIDEIENKMKVFTNKMDNLVKEIQEKINNSDIKITELDNLFKKFNTIDFSLFTKKSELMNNINQIKKDNLNSYSTIEETQKLQDKINTLEKYINETTEKLNANSSLQQNSSKKLIEINNEIIKIKNQLNEEIKKQDLQNIKDTIELNKIETSEQIKNIKESTAFKIKLSNFYNKDEIDEKIKEIRNNIPQDKQFDTKIKEKIELINNDMNQKYISLEKKIKEKMESIKNDDENSINDVNTELNKKIKEWIEKINIIKKTIENKLDSEIFENRFTELNNIMQKDLKNKINAEQYHKQNENNQKLIEENVKNLKKIITTTSETYQAKIEQCLKQIESIKDSSKKSIEECTKNLTNKIVTLESAQQSKINMLNNAIQENKQKTKGKNNKNAINNNEQINEILTNQNLENRIKILENKISNSSNEKTFKEDIQIVKTEIGNEIKNITNELNQIKKLINNKKDNKEIDSNYSNNNNNKKESDSNESNKSKETLNKFKQKIDEYKEKFKQIDNLVDRVTKLEERTTNSIALIEEKVNKNTNYMDEYLQQNNKNNEIVTMDFDSINKQISEIYIYAKDIRVDHDKLQKIYNNRNEYLDKVIKLHTGRLDKMEDLFKYSNWKLTQTKNELIEKKLQYDKIALQAINEEDDEEDDIKSKEDLKSNNNQNNSKSQINILKSELKPNSDNTVKKINKYKNIDYDVNFKDFKFNERNINYPQDKWNLLTADEKSEFNRKRKKFIEVFYEYIDQMEDIQGKETLLKRFKFYRNKIPTTDPDGNIVNYINLNFQNRSQNRTRWKTNRFRNPRFQTYPYRQYQKPIIYHQRNGRRFNNSYPNYESNNNQNNQQYQQKNYNQQRNYNPRRNYRRINNSNQNYYRRNTYPRMNRNLRGRPNFNFNNNRNNQRYYNNNPRYYNNNNYNQAQQGQF